MSARSATKAFLRRAIRLPLRLVQPDWRIPILAGPSRGLKWIAGSATHGHWLGTFDLATRRVFEREVVPGSVVYEMGAYVGYYTLQASVLVGPRGRVFAFEPSRQSLSFLRRHLLINHITNVTVVEAAVGEYSGTTPFWVNVERPSISRPSDNGSERVAMVSLDDFIRSQDVPLPDLIKIDVVGSEPGLLKGAKELLETHHPTLILRVHSFDLDPPWPSMLREMGYEVIPFEGRDFSSIGGILATRSSTQADPGHPRDDT